MKNRRTNIGGIVQQCILVSCLLFTFFQNADAMTIQDDAMQTQGIIDDIIGGGDGSGVSDKVIDDVEDDTGLPNGSIVNDLIPNIISVVLGIFSVLLTITALWSGTLFLIQFGDEERVTKAKQLLIWSLVGVAVTAVSYAYVSGIVNMNWNG